MASGTPPVLSPAGGGLFETQKTFTNRTLGVLLPGALIVADFRGTSGGSFDPDSTEFVGNRAVFAVQSLSAAMGDSNLGIWVVDSVPRTKIGFEVGEKFSATFASGDILVRTLEPAGPAGTLLKISGTNGVANQSAGGLPIYGVTLEAIATVTLNPVRLTRCAWFGLSVGYSV